MLKSILNGVGGGFGRITDTNLFDLTVFILNSDALGYGGNGFVNSRAIIAKQQEMDGRPYQIKIKLAPLSISVFRYSKMEEKIIDNNYKKSRTIVIRKSGKSRVEKVVDNVVEIVVEKVVGKVEKERKKGK